jgi:glutamate/aspartate transport system substrate-binding protein
MHDAARRKVMTIASSMRAAALALSAAVLGLGVHAQEVPPAPAALTGTLAKVRQSGTIALGYRESSVPFSYVGPRKEPIGYSVELCKALVA